MSKEFGRLIKSKRASKRITQEHLSELLSVDCKSVRNWESGKCKPLGSNLSSVLRILEIEETELPAEMQIKEVKRMRKHANLFNDMRVFDSRSPESTIYEGLEAAYRGYAQYLTEYRLISKLREYSDPNSSMLWDVESWLFSNKYLFFICITDNEIVGIREYGRYMLDNSYIFFKEGLIPFVVSDDDDIDSIKEKAESALKLLFEEMAKKTKFESKKYALIYHRIGCNDYDAVCISTGDTVYVSNFKEYRKDYKVEIVGEDDEYIDVTYNFSVIVPSDELCLKLGLSLYHMKYFMRHIVPDVDEWEERPERVLDKRTLECFGDVYQKAVEIANKGRKKKYINEEELWYLEIALDRAERESLNGFQNSSKEELEEKLRKKSDILLITEAGFDRILTVLSEDGTFYA